MKSRWSKTTYFKIQEDLRREFKELLQTKKPHEVLEIIRERLENLEDSDSEMLLLRRFILHLFLLSHHLKFGGLSTKEMKETFDEAFTILKLKAITPHISRLDFLISDLYVAQSQIFREQGQHILGYWAHQRGLQLQNPERAHQAFFAWTLGNRALRLGHAQKAVRYYEEARTLTKTQEQTLLPRLRLSYLKCLRLAKNFPRAEEIEAEILAAETDSDVVQEVGWEKVCRQVSAYGDALPLLQFVQNQKNLLPSYVLEAYFWRLCVQTDRHEFKLPKIPTLIRKIEATRNRALVKAGSIFDQLADTEIPLELRLKDLVGVLENMAHLEGVEYELLVWLAATRWLARNNLQELASVCLREYQTLSWRLSDGRDGDALGIAGDLLEKEWR